MTFDSPVLQRLLNDAVEEFARATKFPLSFGGFERCGTATVTSLSGTRSLSLQGLRVERGRGLGGRAMSELRPRLTADYMRSRHITHDYDPEIRTEGIVALFAMPVIVDGAVRAVLYGGSRGSSGPGNAFLSGASGVAAELGREIRVQDEVARRVSAEREERRAAIPAPVLEELRRGHAELRQLTATVADPDLRARLNELEQRFARIGGSPKPGSSRVTITHAPVHLTPREVDVLSQAGVGLTNAQIGSALGLTESTVKSYLKSAMAKLEASTRYAAVAEARRLGLIP